MFVGITFLLLPVALFFLGTLVRRYEENRWPPMERFGELAYTAFYGAIFAFGVAVVLLVVSGVFFWVLRLVGLEFLAIPAALALGAMGFFEVLRKRARRTETSDT